MKDSKKKVQVNDIIRQKRRTGKGEKEKSERKDVTGSSSGTKRGDIKNDAPASLRVVAAITGLLPEASC